MRFSPEVVNPVSFLTVYIFCLECSLSASNFSACYVAIFGYFAYVDRTS